MEHINPINILKKGGEIKTRIVMEIIRQNFTIDKQDKHWTQEEIS